MPQQPHGRSRSRPGRATPFWRPPRSQAGPAGCPSLPVCCQPDASSCHAGPSSAVALSEPRLGQPSASRTSLTWLLVRALAAMCLASGALLCLAAALVLGAVHAAGGHWQPLLSAWLTAEVAFWAWFRLCHVRAMCNVLRAARIPGAGAHNGPLQRHLPPLLLPQVPRFDAQPKPHMPAALDARLHFKRVLTIAKFYADNSSTIDWHQYLTRWFCGARLEDIRLGNLHEASSAVHALLCACRLRAMWKRPTCSCAATSCNAAT